MDGHCRRCGREFGQHLPHDKEYPNLCVECVEEAKEEMNSLDAELEDMALKYDILTSRCPEL